MSEDKGVGLGRVLWNSFLHRGINNNFAMGDPVQDPRSKFKNLRSRVM